MSTHPYGPHRCTCTRDQECENDRDYRRKQGTTQAGEASASHAPQHRTSIPAPVLQSALAALEAHKAVRPLTENEQRQMRRLRQTLTRRGVRLPRRRTVPPAPRTGDDHAAHA